MGHVREGIAAWEDEGGGLYPPLDPPFRLRRRRRRWTRGAAARPRLERGRSRAWSSNATRRSRSRASVVFLALVLAPLFIVPAVLLSFLLVPVVLVASPMALFTFLLR